MINTLGITPDAEQILREFRRQLHRHPEIGLEEFETTKQIISFLDTHGIERLDYPLKTGVLAIVRGKHPGPAVAVRADIDALPVLEETGLPYASEVHGKMHACGHDFHTSCVLGAALIAKELADSDTSFAGQILFVFQPAEELGVGASMIMDTGVFTDYEVKAIIGEHNNPQLPSGHIGVKAGSLMGSVDEFRIVIHGKGGHAAIPNAAVDPILIAAHVVAGLQHIVSRTVSPLDNAVVTVGQLHAGTASNVIPMEAVLEGTVRALQPDNRELIETRLRTFVEQTASAFGGRAEIEYHRELPVVVNDPRLADIVRDAAVEVVGRENVVEATPTLGGEDFALYQEALPGCFFWVGTGKPDGSSEGWHHPKFDVDEKMIPVTSEVFVRAALSALARF
jgi:N-acetylcysteine deacetylase